MDGVSLGPLLIRWNGALIALGVALGALLSAVRARKRDFDPEIIFDLFLPVAVWGTLGARLWHILTPSRSALELGLTAQYYFSHPIEITAFWAGGYGIAGAWLGGILGLWYFCRKHEYPFWELADILAPGLALAQGIGRLGNYFNQELYGLPTSFFLKVFIDPDHRLDGYETVNFYHPLFAYESLLNFANMALLLWLSRRFADKLERGDLFLAYLGFYSLVRFLLEFLRLDVSVVAGVNVNQAFFAFAFLGVAVSMFLRRRAVLKTVRSL
ncbi:MAG: prolipoprotein diacylglyceryl transferase [Chloroflexi bacterium]|nr:prolipoprotein diacylglyceryl transferase [Chloroflexota bacterium]